jgi:hypothetical protein
VARVEVSVDGGVSWAPAEFRSPTERHVWRRWEYTSQATTRGPVALRSRAFDAAGHTQPHEPEWNHLGYANNTIQVVRVHIL